MAAGGGGGGQEGAEKNTYYILWVFLLVAAIVWTIWYFFKEQLKTAFIAIRTVELVAIKFVIDLVPDNLPWVGDYIQQAQIELAADVIAVRSLTPGILTLDMADLLSTASGEYLRYPFILYFIFLVIIVFKSNVQARLKHKFNMKTLAAQEQKNWPQIKIATKLDLLAEDLDTGPWSMALTPMQYSKRNKLINVEYAEGASTSFSKSQMPEYKVVLDKIRAQRIFSVQLGRAWQGIEAMAPHRRAIFAIFLGRGSRDTKACADLVAQLAISAADGKLDCTGADALWKKHMKIKRVQDICNAHAYEFTAFISALQYAREDGVLASSDFLWVKPLDRRLWYVINNVGRQTIGVEVGGIFCHWYYEMALRRSLSVPRIDNCVDALELAISEIIYIPDDKEKEEIMKRYHDRQTAANTVPSTG
jgi:intracellular multiplication protein IcmP